MNVRYTSVAAWWYGHMATTAAQFPELTLRVEPAHREAYVDLGPGGQISPAQFELAVEALRSWAPVGRGLIKACAAYAKGDATRAADLLDPVISNITVVGGSDAQVDLFRQTYFRSLLDCGRKSEAKAYWLAQTAGKTLSPLDQQWLGLAA